jgi:PAS domain S-box-containing protein
VKIDGFARLIQHLWRRLAGLSDSFARLFTLPETPSPIGARRYHQRLSRRELEAQVEQHSAELARANQLLVEREMQLRAIVEHSADAIYVKDRSGRYLSINPAGAAFLNRPVEAIVGLRDSELLSPEASREIEEFDQRVLALRRPLTDEQLLVINGVERTFLTTKFPYRADDGVARGVVGISRDITERKRMEQALRASEERFRRLSEAAFEGIVVHDKGHILDANQVYADLYGWELADLIGVQAIELAAPESRDLVAAHIHSEYDQPYEAVALRKDGSRFPIEICGKNIAYQGRSVRVTAVRDITERKRAEQALREAETRYRTLVEQLPAIIYIVALDEAGSTIYVNPQIETILGFTPDEWIADPGLWLKQVHPDDRTRVLEQVWRGQTAGNLSPSEYRLLRRDGQVVWIRDQSVVIRDADRQPLFLQGILIDISQRKWAEEARRESEARLRLVAQATNDAIWDWDLSADTVWWSKGIEALFGYPRDATVSTLSFWANCLHPDDQERVQASLAIAIGCGESIWSSEYRFRCADGSYTYVLDRGIIVRDAVGTAVRMVGVIIDITEHKQTEHELNRLNTELTASTEQLRHSRDLLRTLFDSLDDGLVLLDDRGQVLVANRAIAALFGGAARMIVGQQWAAVCDRYGLAILSQFALQTLRDGQARRRREHYVDQNGSHHVLDIGALPVLGRSDAVEQLIVHVIDITERLQLEELVIQSERFSASGKLAATIAHEVNTPLQTIQNLLYLAGAAPAAPRERYLALVRDEIARIGAILRQLLDFYQPGDSAATTIDLNAMVERVLLLTSATLTKHGIAVKRELAPHLPLIQGRADHLTQVLLNLTLNAVDAMPHGGRLRLATRTENGDSAHHTPPGGSQSVVLQIADSGVGMAPDVRARAFEPFFTTKSGGSGLGLAISWRIMRQHGGSIAIDSAPGAGSTFTLVFPPNGESNNEGDDAISRTVGRG